MSGERVCKDCVTESGQDAFIRPGVPKRKANHPGPRCMSHHRAKLKAMREKAHARRIEAEYGITIEQYRQLYEFQGERCYICRRANGATRRLSVDHDHRTGFVRGLLCRPCNTMLGHARDETSFFGRAIVYLTNPPAKQLDMWVRPNE